MVDILIHLSDEEATRKLTDAETLCLESSRQALGPLHPLDKPATSWDRLVR